MKASGEVKGKERFLIWYIMNFFFNLRLLLLVWVISSHLLPLHVMPLQGTERSKNIESKLILFRSEACGYSFYESILLHKACWLRCLGLFSQNTSWWQDLLELAAFSVSRSSSFKNHSFTSKLSQTESWYKKAATWSLALIQFLPTFHASSVSIYWGPSVSWRWWVWNDCRLSLLCQVAPVCNPLVLLRDCWHRQTCECCEG